MSDDERTNRLIQELARAERAALQADDLDAVGVVVPLPVVLQPARRPREHLERTHDVQHLDVRVREHRDAERSPPRRRRRFPRSDRAALHGERMPRPAGRDNDNVPTFSAKRRRPPVIFLDTGKAPEAVSTETQSKFMRMPRVSAPGPRVEVEP